MSNIQEETIEFTTHTENVTEYNAFPTINDFCKMDFSPSANIQ